MHRFACRLTVLMLQLPVLAYAKDPDAAAPAAPDPAVAVGPIPPSTLTPRIGSAPALVVATSGFDGAQKTTQFEAATEIRLAERLAIRAGAVYTDDGSDPIRPTFGARLQLLDQRRFGFDASAAVMFRPTGVRNAEWDDGALVAAILLGRQDGRLSTFLDLGYQQDPEGDDRAADVRAASMLRLARTVCAGLDLRGKFDLGSTETRRPGGPSSYELSGGPFATWALGRFVLLAQTGASAVARDDLRVGALLLAGGGAVF